MCPRRAASVTPADAFGSEGNGGGGISVAELKLYFHGSVTSDEEVDGEFRGADADGDGQLSFEEFMVKTSSR